MLRNPSPPPEYRCINPPVFEWIKIPDEHEIDIDFGLLKKWGYFDIDIPKYEKMTFDYNLDEDDDIQIVPVEGKEKSIELVTVESNDEDDNEDIMPMDKIKKEKEENIEKTESDEVKETKRRIDVTEVKNTEQRVVRMIIDKDSEDVSATRKKDDHKEKKHQEKKTKEDEGNKHKKCKIEEFDKYFKKKNKQHRRDKEDEEVVEKRPKKRHSSSHVDDYEDYRTKREYNHPIKEEDVSFLGVFYCDICNLTLNSQVTFDSHMIGKRHKKNQDAKNVVQALAKTYVPIQLASKCPRPLLGYRRVGVNVPAKIQKFLDKELETSLGLQKVIEIRSPTETSYYCSLCDAPCSVSSILPHLKGFKHQLTCLKYYDTLMYDEINYKPKFQIEKKIQDRLRIIEKKLGRKCVLTVEEDIPDTGSYDPYPCIPSTSCRDLRDQPSTSKQDADFTEIFMACSQPDQSKSGFYCKICDSHSNSQAMWDAHIRGKRHIANVKKGPDATPSKCRYIPAPSGTTPKLFALLKDVDDEPIVGLDQIREIIRKDIDSVSYNCFLCNSYLGEKEIVDHIISRKHREKYLDKINYHELESLRSLHMHNQTTNNLIKEMCEKVQKQGSGELEVYYDKNSLVKP